LPFAFLVSLLLFYHFRIFKKHAIIRQLFFIDNSVYY